MHAKKKLKMCSFRAPPRTPASKTPWVAIAEEGTTACEEGVYDMRGSDSWREERQAKVANNNEQIEPTVSKPG